MEKFDTIIKYYEKNIAEAPTIDSKIKYMSEFWEIRTLLDKKSYDKQISFFTGKYTVDELGKNVAEQYYIKGDNIKAVRTDDYLSKAEAYEAGLTYYSYKDIKQKAEDYRFKYSELKAGEYYNSGVSDEKTDVTEVPKRIFLLHIISIKIMEATRTRKSVTSLTTRKQTGQKPKSCIRKQNHRKQQKINCDAAETFAEADDAYEKHGNYKDSSELGEKNDKLCRQEAADKYYQEARSKEYSARTKREYRDIAQIYNSAYTAYQRYGEYKDSYRKYQDLEEKGKVKVYIAGDMDNIVKDSLKSDFIVLTNSYSSADVRIRIVVDDNGYKQHPEPQLRSRMSYEVSGYMNDRKKIQLH